MIVHNKFTWLIVLKESISNILYSTGAALFAYVIHIIFEMNSWQIPMTIIATLGTALAIILGFRNGSAYDRWWEARKIWGGLVNDSRSFTRQVLTLINLKDAGETAEISQIHKDILHTHIGFINALRLQLRGVRDENGWLKPVFSNLNDQTRKYVGEKSNKATHILIEQGRKLENCAGAGFIDEFRHMQMDSTLTRFSDYQGKSERIKNTPIPRAYEIFTRILMDLFILFLPFALMPIFNNINAWWLVFPITILIGWVFYAIHKLGVIMANPFENFRWDVPLDAICNTIEIDMLEAMNSTEVPAKLQPVDGILM